MLHFDEILVVSVNVREKVLAKQGFCDSEHVAFQQPTTQVSIFPTPKLASAHS